MNLVVYTVTIMMFIVNNTHTHTPVCTHTHTHTHVHTCTHTCTLLNVHTYIHSAKDFKNRELFEKMFPELKARREQQERFTRYVHNYMMHDILVYTRLYSGCLCTLVVISL